MYIKYLEKLISFKSVTPKSEGAIEYISNLLEQNNFKTEIKVFGDHYKVTNLYATYGNSKPNICFAGHVDVVPPGSRESWHNDPYIATSIDGNIYGRGAVDMKGAIACFLSASLEFIHTVLHLNGSISLLITSDEEGEAKYGTQKMLEYIYKESKQNIDFAIVGEPTNELAIGDTIKIGRRGSINFHLRLHGIGGHVAYPAKANNPIPCLIAILNELMNNTLDEGSQFFQRSNLVITTIDVDNTVSNVIPSEISTKFNIRFNDLHSSESLTSLIKSVIEKHTSRFSVKYELSSQCSASCFIQEPVGFIEEFSQIVTNTTKIKPTLSTSGGTSDARFIKNYCPVVEFGLLSATAHKINEYTKITDLQSLYRVYYNALQKFLA